MVSLLVRNYFRGHGFTLVAALRAGRAKSKAAKVLMPVLYGLLSLCWMAMLAGEFMLLMPLAPELGALAYVATVVVFPMLFTIPAADNVLVNAKDIPALRAMPISGRDFLASRLIVLVVESLFESLLVFIPFAIGSCITLGFRPLLIALAFAAAVAAPLAVSSAVSALTYICVRWYTAKRLKQVFLYALLAVFCCALSWGVGKLNSGDEIYAAAFGADARAVDLTGASMILAGAVGVSLLAAAVLAPVAVRLSSWAVKYTAKAKKGKAREGRARSVNRALLSRELSLVFQDGATAMELVMESALPAFLLALYSVMGMATEILGSLETVSDAGHLDMGLVLAAVCFLMSSFNLTSSTSVSREGRGFDISRTLPVAPEEFVKAKFLFHMLFVGVPSLCFTTVSLAFGGSGPLGWAFAVPYCISLNAAVSLIGLRIDYSNPHTTWERPQEAVKSNTNGAIGMGLSVVLLMAGIGLHVVFSHVVAAPALAVLAPTLLNIVLALALARPCAEAARVALEF